MARLRAGRGGGDRAAARDGRRARPRTARRGRRGPTTSRSCSAPAPAISTSRRRSRRAASAPTSTRASASSTRRRCRTCRRCCATSRSRSPTCARPSSCGRASCASPTSGSRAWRRRSRARSGRRTSTPRPRASTSSTRGSLAQAATALARWLALADRITPSELVDLDPSRVRVRLRDARPPARSGARERQEGARARSGASRAAATRRSAASPTTSRRCAPATNRTPWSRRPAAVNLMTIHAAKGLEFPDRVRRQPAGARPASGRRFTVIERAINRASRTSRSVSRPEHARGGAPRSRRAAPAAVRRGHARARSSLPRGRNGGRRTLEAAGAQPGRVASGEPGDRGRAGCARLVGDQRGRATTARSPFASSDRSRPRLGRRSPRARRAPRLLAAPAPGGRQVPSRRRPSADRAARSRESRRPGVTTERLTGTLVHRLFERRLPPTATASDVRLAVPPLVRIEELVDVADVPALEHSVVDLYLALRSRADVSGLLAAGPASTRCRSRISPRTATRRTRCSFAAWSTAWS